MEDTQTKTDIRDNKGRWLVPPPGSEKTRITADNARQMVQKRVEKYRRAAVQKIVEEAKSIDPSVSVAADAFGLLAAKQFTTIMDSEKPAMADVEKLHRLMTGGDGNSQRENAQAAPGAISGTPDALMQLVDMIEKQRAAAVDQARAVDATVTDIRNE
jgi:hypothetical protein